MDVLTKLFSEMSLNESVELIQDPIEVCYLYTVIDVDVVIDPLGIGPPPRLVRSVNI